MRMKINCLSCGHSMELSDAYEDYSGEVRCWGCRTSLQVTIENGKLKAMQRATSDVDPPRKTVS
jgi:hypothetical protein